MTAELNTGIAVIALTQGMTAFTHFLPSLSKVLKASMSTDRDLTADVRLGEVAAVGVTMGTGAIVSSLTKSNVPIIISAVVCLGFVCLYEMTLRGDRPLERKDSVDTERLGNS